MKKKSLSTAAILKKVLFYLLIFAICIVMLIPVYLIAKVSFSTKGEILTQHPTLFIHEFTFEHWASVFKSGNLWEPLKRSLIVSTFTTILSLVIVVPASYVVSRMEKKKRYIFILGLFFTRMVPSVAIALPISVTFLKMGLIDTIPGLVLANMISQIPFMAWILVSSFSEIPISLDEAAWIDGCTKFQAIRKVILPVSMQGIAVAAMYVWLNAWNEFTYAMYLSQNSKTMPLQIYYYISRGSVFERAAYSTILAIPVILITFVLQRYLKPDYLGGSVKG
jgi:ABC-type glycerol-3-phosphate transport system permease component